MGRYAAGTEVSVDRSLDELRRTLRRFGAQQFAFSEEDGRTMVAFRKDVRLSVSMPGPDDRAFTRTETGRVRKPSAAREARRLYAGCRIEPLAMRHTAAAMSTPGHSRGMAKKITVHVDAHGREQTVLRESGRFAEKPREAAAGEVALGDPRADLGEPAWSGEPGWTEGETWASETEVKGTLRQRVLDRLGVADGKVAIHEETHWGGTSEWTQENDHDFWISCGDERIHFPSEPSEGRGGFESGSSVFARFQDWLRAGEEPEAVLAEWMPDGRTVDPKATIAWELSGDRIVVESEGDHSMLVVEHDEQTDRHGFPVPARRKVRCRLAAQIDDQPALARALADRLLVRRGTR